MSIVNWRVAAWLLLVGVLTMDAGSTPTEDSKAGDADQAPKELISDEGEKTQDLENTTLPINIVAASDITESPKSSQKDKLFFFASYQTMSHIIVTYDTTTVPLFCLSGTNAVACPAGRKKRQSFPIKFKEEQYSSDFVESSQDLDAKTDDPVGDLEDGGRKFFTIWTKVLTTTTLTSTSTNSASTITVSYYCTAGSLELPPLCG